VKKLLLVAPLLAAGCAAGPGPLHHGWDDWTNKQYLTDVIPAYRIVGMLAWIPDWLVLNPVQFWGNDVWDGKGAAFTHENPTSPETAWYSK
jgi:hypothetical protein